MKPMKQRNVVPKKTASAINTPNKNRFKRQSVKVFCRLRTNTDPDRISCVHLKSPTQLLLRLPELSCKKTPLVHNFNHIFTEHGTQKEVFMYIVAPLLHNLLMGENGLLFTYGITGSGKTYTMTGDQTDPGIIPRCINVLFNTIGPLQTRRNDVRSDKMNGFELSEEDVDFRKDTRFNKKKPGKKDSDENSMLFLNDGLKMMEFDEDCLYAVFVSYTEIYNNLIYDLLDENVKIGGQYQAKIVREDCHGNVYVNGCAEIEVKSTEEAFELYCLGKKRKRVAQTNMNNASSRSHSIFNIRVVKVATDSQYNRVLTTGQLSLVDLAGSERCNRAQTTGKRLKEAGSINNSLMSLRYCLEILRENQKTGSNRLIPYRDYRLTHLFKYFFEGAGTVQMIICVNPSVQDYDENLHVMKFAEISKEVLLPYSPVPTPTIIPSSSSKETIPQDLEVEKLNVSCQTVSPETKYYPKPDKNFPKFGTLRPDCGEIKDVILYLKGFSQHAANRRHLDQISDELRKKLIVLQQEKIWYEEQAKYVLPKEMEKKEALKSELLQTRFIKEKVYEESKKREETISDLKHILDEKNFKLRQSLLEKAKQKEMLKDVRELELKFQRQRELMNNELTKKSEKIELIQQIVSSTENLGTVEKPGSSAQFSEPFEEIPRSTSPIIIDNESVDEDKENATEKEDTLYSRRMAPVSNRRYRRSQSCDRSRWLKHTQRNPTPLGTVLKPSIKCNKSVHELTKIKDVVNSKQNKYVLIAQGQDLDGDLETKLYKGDIIPTCCGGAQVVFDDVEKLKQESPTHHHHRDSLTLTSTIRKRANVHNSTISEIAKKTKSLNE